MLVDGVLGPAALRWADGVVTSIVPGADDAEDGAGLLRVPDSAVVLPGVVDSHVHVNEPGRTHWEGFATATRAAALGGVTTLVDMPLNSVPPTTTVAGLRAKQQAAAGQLAVDVGFWGGAVPGNLADLRPLWDEGVLGFKCFLSPSGVEEFPPLDPAGFTAALREVSSFDGLVVVHAEDAAVLEAAPTAPSRAYADFLASRPDEAELAAIRQVLDGARETGCRVHVLHLSSARALDLLADARAEGLPVTVETCPHYLCLAAEHIPDGDAAYKCCPPIRDEGNRDALWDALLAGVIDMVVSDHSPADVAAKTSGGGDLMQAWGGIAGLQVAFLAVADEATRRGIGIESVSRWMSTATADLVGLSAKGRLAVGGDADLLVLDPAASTTVDAAALAHRHPISAYDGRRLSGRVTDTVLRGRRIASGRTGPSDEPRTGLQLTRPEESP
ncbi:allantoinase AllB [Nocardioidaceae bacterium]|nr:allantoinase AllB [Nocardioidaceae bacterium]